MESTLFKSLLRKRNLKATTSRLALIDALTSYGSAMPYSAIQKELMPIDRVTLYRNIETLNRHGVIHKAFQEGSDVFYAMCGGSCNSDTHHHDHIHFKCMQCKKVTCEEANCEIMFSNPTYEVQKISVYIEGMCSTCKPA